MAKDAWNHIEDKELLQKFYSDGNNYWLGLLLERYTLLLFGVCMKYLKDEEEAKDAVQQIFLKAIIELQKYKVEFFKSWLYIVAKNQCLMKLRTKQNHPSVELSDNIYSDESTGIYWMQNKEKILSMIEDGLHELNSEQKTCVTLFYLQKKSYQEITTTTGYNLLQVKSFIQNGKRKLKLIVEKKIKQTNV